MSRTRQTRVDREDRPPTISRAEGRRRFELMMQKGRELLANRPLVENAAIVWANTTLGYIKDTFGYPTPHVSTFLGQTQIRMGGNGYDAYAEREVAEKLAERIDVLKNLIDVIELEADFSPSGAEESKTFDFWSELHPDIQAHSKPRFEAGHFADAVEAAFKHACFSTHSTNGCDPHGFFLSLLESFSTP